MVCQNQSIDDSDAPLAKDLRVLVRERLTAGDSDRQVIDFLVARYGEFVLLQPRLNADTVLLWLAPFAVVTGRRERIDRVPAPPPREAPAPQRARPTTSAALPSCWTEKPRVAAMASESGAGALCEAR